MTRAGDGSAPLTWRPDTYAVRGGLTRSEFDETAEAVFLTYVFTLQSMASGIIYFLLFFAATCIYLIPLLFAGWLGRMQEFRTAARFSAFLVGILFLIHAILRL